MKIPAANIGDIDLDDLAKSNFRAAKEIARLRDMMNLGKETDEEFKTLCQLLHDVGSVASAEILLRRNLDCCDGDPLYTNLFGTAKPDEFEAAIEAFKLQFNIELALTARG